MVRRLTSQFTPVKGVLLLIGLNCILLCGAVSARDLVFQSDFELGNLNDWSAVVGEGLPTITITLPGGVTIDLNHVPAGRFWMGTREEERGRKPWEDIHEVVLTHGYYMGVTEVTQAQWQAVTGAAMPTDCGLYGVGPDYPVYCVSWDDVAAPGGFVDLMNAYLTSTGQSGAGLYRLPTEAEWERAARGDTQTEFSFEAPSDWDLECGSFPEAESYMVWCGDDDGEAEPVGSKLANLFGLCDMHGNLWELVEDWWTPHLGHDPVTDPTGPTTGTSRVTRGGDWYNHADLCRSASRFYVDPADRGGGLGFRLARSE